MARMSDIALVLMLMLVVVVVATVSVLVLVLMVMFGLLSSWVNITNRKSKPALPGVCHVPPERLERRGTGSA